MLVVDPWDNHVWDIMMKMVMSMATNFIIIPNNNASIISITISIINDDTDNRNHLLNHMRVKMI